MWIYTYSYIYIFNNYLKLLKEMRFVASENTDFYPITLI